jgi:predicted RNA-binding protein YlxR (DUF448 family)
MEEPAPRRTCVGCRRVAAAHTLVRVRTAPDGGLAVGPGAGRGAWFCTAPRTVECLDRALRKGALAKALRRPVATNHADDLRARLANRISESDTMTNRTAGSEER